MKNRSSVPQPNPSRYLLFFLTALAANLSKAREGKDWVAVAENLI
jgi:hypothetical protein